MMTRINFSGLLEAIAITAMIQKRWPLYNSETTRSYFTDKCAVVSIPVVQQGQLFETNFGPSRSTFIEEKILMEKAWTGSRYIWLGFGHLSNTLVVNMEQP